MPNNILSYSTLECTGCGACSTACPHHAITIDLNSDGFFSPFIHKQKCVDCGICKRVCYRFLPIEQLPSIAKSRVIGCHSSNHHTHATTTSGGIGHEIARWGIEHGYNIFGTTYNYDSHEAHSIIAESVEDIELLKGSKYIQAYTETAINRMIELLDNNPTEKFICIGTPCQIFGIRNILRLKRLRNDVLFVDLFCHGVPSYLVWKPYIEYMTIKTGTIRKIDFRYKGNGWHQYSIHIEGAAKSYTRIAYADPFYRYFFDNVALNASCYNCRLRKRQTAADIRIGDFLGPQYEHREDGISAVVAATEQGRRLLDALCNDGRITICGEHDAEDALKAQSTLDYDTRHLRDEVIRRLHKGNIADVQRWYFGRLPLKSRLRSLLKRGVSKLPLRATILLRRASRSINA